jgi:hypothetical protein
MINNENKKRCVVLYHPDFDESNDSAVEFADGLRKSMTFFLSEIQSGGTPMTVTVEEIER